MDAYVDILVNCAPEWNKGTCHKGLGESRGTQCCLYLHIYLQNQPAGTSGPVTQGKVWIKLDLPLAVGHQFEQRLHSICMSTMSAEEAN